MAKGHKLFSEYSIEVQKKNQNKISILDKNIYKDKTFKEIKKIDSLLKNMKNKLTKNHIDLISMTKGSYFSKRNVKVLSRVNSIYNFMHTIMNEELSLKTNSIPALYCDIYDLLNNRETEFVTKTAFKYVTKIKYYDKSIIYVTLYLVLALVLETIAFYFTEIEFNYQLNNVQPIKLLDDFCEQHVSFVKSVLFKAENIIVFIKKSDFYRSGIKYITKDNELTSKESTNIVSQESIGVFLAGIFFVVIGLYVLVFTIKTLVYWFNTINIDVNNFLIEFADKIEVNISLLRKDYENEKDPKKKEYLGEVIKRQEEKLERIRNIIKQAKESEDIGYYETEDKINDDIKEEEKEEKEEDGELLL